MQPQGALGTEVVHEHVGRVRAEVPTLVINNRRSTNMAGIELLSDQGYRLDGRKATELRKVEARMGVFGQADGSAYLEQGNTKVLAVVYGPHEVSGTLQHTSPDNRLEIAVHVSKVPECSCTVDLVRDYVM